MVEENSGAFEGKGMVSTFEKHTIYNMWILKDKSKKKWINKKLNFIFSQSSFIKQPQDHSWMFVSLDM